MHRTLRAVVAGLTFLLASSLTAEELPFTQMTPDGNPPLTSGSVQKIMQDHQGFIWFAFYSSGVSRYDGHSLEAYSIGDGLADVTVREIAEDSTGRLWIASESGLVASTKRLDDYSPNERIHFTSKFGNSVIPPNRARRNCLAADKNGWVWLGTGGDGLKLYRVTGDKLETKSISTDIFGAGKDEPVTAITLRRDGTIWVALNNGLFLTFAPNGTQKTVDPRDDNAERKAAVSMVEGRSGRLWIGHTDGSVISYQPGANPAVVDMHSPLTERIASLLEARSGELWAVSLGTGMASFSPKNDRAPHAFHPADGVLSDTFWHAIEDTEGNLWFGQNGGVSRLSHDYAAFGRYSKRTLPEPSVFAIVPPRPIDIEEKTAMNSTPVTCSGGGAPLWLGTGGGVDAICNGAVVATLKMQDGLASNSIYALSVDHEGRLWIGTQQGLNCLTFDGSSKPPTAPESTRKVTVLGKGATLSTFSTGLTPIYACRSLKIKGVDGKPVESLWFTGSGGLWCLVGEEWHYFQKGAGLPATGTTGVAVDREGYLWVGTPDRGLQRSVRPISVTELQQLAKASTPQNDLSLAALMTLSVGEISVQTFQPIWSNANGAKSNSVRNLLRNGDKMLVGTAAGLGVLQQSPPKPLSFFDQQSGLGGDAIVGMAVSPTSNEVWVSQNAGLAMLDSSMQHVTRVVSKHDGLVDNEAWAYGSVAADATGAIYLGTPNGLAIVRPSLMSQSSTAPPLRWKHASFEEKKDGTNELKVEYAALSYASSDRLRFKRRLLGYENEWSAETKEVSTRYTNLRAFLFPKNYTFEVLASNDAGVWGKEPLRYTFQVPPPAWLSWWMVLIYLLVGVVLVRAYVKTQR